MQVISLKEYAENNHVSYEAVRKQVVRYAAELEGHIIRDGRQQFLDEEAVAFLDEKRKKNPVVIYEANKDEEIERLKHEKENLLLKIATVQDQLIQAQNENKALKEENQRIFLLEADNEAAKQKLEATEAQLQTTECVAKANEQEAEQAKKEASEAKEKAGQERQRAEQVEKELSDLKTENDLLLARLDEITQEKKTFFQRLSDGIVKFFTE